MPPLPKAPHERRRRNVPPPSQTDRMLPAEGRRGRPPSPPIELGPHGAALWRYLWGTPQATLWSKAHLWGVAERCRLEDWINEPGGENKPTVVASLIQAWDDRWGFNPRSLAQLHMWIEGSTPKPAEAPKTATVADIRERLKDAAG